MVSSSQFPPGQRVSYSVVPLDEHGQVHIEQLAVLDTHMPVDDAQVYVGRLAEDERSERIVTRPPRKAEGVEPVADEIRRHAWGEHADVVTSERRRAAAGRQPQRLARGERGWATRDAMQQQRNPCLRQQMRAVVGGRAVHAETDARASLPQAT